LSQRLNALLMTDGYEPGEPHWQLAQDGRLMLSVMAGKEEDVRDRSEKDDWVVWHEPWHKVYYSPPVWDLCDSGRWIHLASVYDPEARVVRHYVDGRETIRHRIEARHLVKTIRLGNAEIGNWGQPYRKRPEFAVRNLNGVVDEVLLFQAALSGEEIANMYQIGAPEAPVGND
ncbi:MAG: LamG-like jellyroll fold domain-containing protein, partial [Planctomycetota bacterium]